MQTDGAIGDCTGVGRKKEFRAEERRAIKMKAVFSHR